ncbi:MAG: GNAT family N-acetyltransferase [Cyanobacteria bacterium CRU_2_1]|nr:GNAT family N-acetyltransferase [Cyanobacteria bacterium RU_5_0]NJR60756.1 GNAT family N-acetyltransferase [Cyanobacteria bacterium CRU_2_1]
MVIVNELIPTMTDNPIVPLEKSQVDQISRILGQAFYDDPGYRYIFPETEERKLHHITWLCTLSLRYAQPYGFTYTTENSLKGAAVWIPPGQYPLNTWRILRIGMYATPFKLGMSALRRVLKLLKKLEECHIHDMSMPHWYLYLLGVDPVYQEQGIGSALLQPILQRSDTEKIPCYLKTFNEKNIQFYQKHGFEVVTVVDIADVELQFWSMKRNPSHV